ncbi:MAG: EamA family transporter [Candidatus Marsarchaeota archaeon]|nr:EamA family transporter [Candidatus Marsarchaeota archaeon]
MGKKMTNVLLLVASTFLGAVGQLFFKDTFVAAGFSIIPLLIGLVAYIVSSGIYFYVLSRTHLSWSYSLGGLSYIFTVLFAATLLHESVPLLRWIGVFVITFGVLLIGSS